jgi:hypothetical protein
MSWLSAFLNRVQKSQPLNVIFKALSTQQKMYLLSELEQVQEALTIFSEFSPSKAAQAKAVIDKLIEALS